MTPKEAAFAADLCAERAGLQLDAGRSYRIEAALAPLARREGYLSVPELVRAVRERGDERLVWAMVEALVPAQTAFFRDPAVFEALGREIAALRGRRRDHPVRVLSAGCASGEEAFSLAMLVDEQGPEGAPVEILGVDLSHALLEKAQTGLFSRFDVQRGLSARRLVRCFENRGEAFSLAPRLRRSMRFQRVNLAEDVSRLGRFDVVLCRYVLGGMRPPARSGVLAGLAHAVAPSGWLALSPEDAFDADSLGLQPAPGIKGVYRLAEPLVAAA